MARSETQTRLITGFTLGFFCIAWIFFAPEPVYLGLCLLFLLVSVGEYKTILAHKGIELRPTILYGSVLLGFAAGWCYWKGLVFQGHLALTFAVANPLSFALIRVKENKRQMALWLLAPLLWFVLPYFLLVYLRYLPPEPKGAGLFFWLVFVVGFNDIFAYFGGRQYGKTPLAPKISPKKTREGSMFGLLGGYGAAFGMQPILLPYAEYWQVVVLVPPLVVAAQAGDLLESVFKRYAGVKDSGKILPGHGGVLDRFDALLTTLPVYWLLIYLIGLDQQW